MGENKNHQLGTKLALIGIVGLISFTMILATTPLHEMAHYGMSIVDPYVNPIELKLFNFEGMTGQDDQNFLASTLGYVIIEEAYPGAFQDRPVWADLLQEIFCVLIQIIITCVVVLKSLKLIVQKYPRFIGA